jgi:hypothetical protein
MNRTFERLEMRQMLTGSTLTPINFGPVLAKASDGGPQAPGNFMGQPIGNYGNLPFPSAAVPALHAPVVVGAFHLVPSGLSASSRIMLRQPK